MTQVFNPLKSMSTEDLRKLCKTDPNPIVRFACLREEGERYNFKVPAGRNIKQIIETFELGAML